MDTYFSRGSLRLAIELHNANIAAQESLDIQGSTEGFGPASFVAAVKDLSRAVGKTVGANIRFWSDTFKRSEVKHFHDGNQSRLALFVRDPSKVLPDVPLPIPDGMVGSYMNAVTELNRLDNEVSIINFISAAADAVEPLIHGIDEGFSIASKKLLDEFKPKDVADEISAELKKLFSGRNIQTKTAHDVFNDKEDVALSVEGALQFNDVYRKMVNLAPAVEELNHRFDEIATHLEKKEITFEKDTLKSLYDLVSGVALYIDHFGVLAHEMQRVEHNLVTSVQIIMRHA